MSKIQARHNVDKNVARFGVADSPEMCESVAQSIPAEVLKNAKSILDVGIGCGGIARAIVKRLVNELYVDWNDAILRVYGVDNNLALVNKAKRNGFINTTCEDFLQWQPEMQFDVIVGNPPYSLPKGQKSISDGTKNLSLKFIERSIELLSDGGFISMVTPFNFLKPTDSVKPTRSFSVLSGASLTSVQTGLEREWFPGIGTKIALWCATKGELSSSFRLNGEDWSVNSIPFIVDLNGEELRVFKKIWQRMKTGANLVKCRRVKDGNQLPEQGWSLTERVNRRYGNDFVIPWSANPVREKYEQVHISLDSRVAHELFSQPHVRFFVKATSIEPTVYHNLFDGLDYGPQELSSHDLEVVENFLRK